MGLRKLTALSVFYLLMAPFLILIIWSFSHSWQAGEILPQWGLRGWRYLWEPHSKVFSTLLTSVLLSGTVTVFSLAVSIPAGKALALYQFPGKNLVELLILAPLIVPPLAVGMGIHLAFIKYGLADTFGGVVLVHLTVTLPYSVRVFTSVFKAMGAKWDEQGQILGASAWQRFRHVTWHFLKPGLVTGSALVFNVSFSQYFLTFLIGGGKVVTLPLLLFPFVNSGDRVLASVLSLIFIIASLLFMLLVEKSIADSHKQAEYYYL